MINELNNDMNNPQIHYRTCNLCEAMCGIEITYRDTEILSIKGDKKDPLSRGYICPKAIALQDLQNDPDRIRQPMERTAQGWREITWPDALDKVAAGIKATQAQYGNDAVATYLGNPNVHNMGAMLMGEHFHNAIRTRSKYSATSVDQLPHMLIAYHLFGHQLKIPVPDIDQCSHMLIIGGNPIASNGSIMSVPDIGKRLKAIQHAGGKVVVIDPRRTETAEVASEHYFIRPGSDVLLLLAMLHILFRDKKVKLNHVGGFIKGSSAEAITAIESQVTPYPPQRVASFTGMSVDTIEKIVADFCAAIAPVCYGRMGVSVQRFGLLSQYLIMLFNILTGRLDAPGGMMFTHPAAEILNQIGRGHFGKAHSRVRKLPEFSGEFPVSTLAEEMLTEGPKQIRALVTLAGNPVLSTPNGTQLEQAIEKLDFMVAIDFYFNETTRHANIILPPVTHLEREHYDLVFHLFGVRNTARYSAPLFKPAKDAKHDWQIYLELENRLRPAKKLADKIVRSLLTRLGPQVLLALRLRFGPYGGGMSLFKGLTLSKLKKEQHGIDLGALKPSLPSSLYHQDKKIDLQLDFYMQDLKRVEEHFFLQQPTGESGMLLIGRRHVRSNNSWLHNSYRLVKGKSRCTAQINPQDAERINLQENQLLKVSSRTGSILVEPEITDAIMPGVISIPHGWGHDRQNHNGQSHQQGEIKQQIAAQHAGVSVNDLTDDQLIDSLSGNAVLNGVPVTVEVLSRE